MSFDQDPNEQANISGADLAIMDDEMKAIKQQRDELLAALNAIYDLRPFGKGASEYALTVERMARSAVDKAEGRS